MSQHPDQDPADPLDPPDHRILEALEACRPGSEDRRDPGLAPLDERLAQDPELRERYRRTQSIDASLAAAFQDVPIPQGLSDRLLARLADATREAPSLPPGEGRGEGIWDKRGGSSAGDEGMSLGSPDTQLQVMPFADAPTPAPADRSRSAFRSRRWLLGTVAAGLVGTAAAVLLCVWLGRGSRLDLRPAEVLDSATVFFNDESAASGERLADKRPPESYPLSDRVVSFPQIQWHRVRGFLDSSGVAYDLSGLGAGRATLYVVRRTVDGLPAQPPLTPRPTTAGCSAAAWQEGPVLYVLVVEGGVRTYRQCIKGLPQGPLT
ncbi:MAG: hypothetical protein ABSG68_19670 [Thermoguttaceae bacterium]|jgi:hypothetical protein